MEAVAAKMLSQIEEGQTVKVVRINGGRGLRARLTTMGLLPNTPVTVIRNSRAGPFVISVKNTKIAIGRGVVDKIAVS
jgi:ferrous iron transport protein A